MLKRPARPETVRAYEAYYGLVEPPFSLSPGLRFAYKSRSHASALREVREALRRGESLIVVTGEVGTGKTMLCRGLLQDSDAHTFTSLILDPCATAEEMLVQILSDFGLIDRDALARHLAVSHFSRNELLSILQRFLASLARLGGRAAIVIDEAQHLHPAVLEQIRLWSNFETNETKLLQIVLAGQQELDDVLSRPEMRQIRQRVSRRCDLEPLSHEEVAHYIEHRLSVARGPSNDPRGGMSGPRGVLAQGESWRPCFDPRAIGAVVTLSGGIPRVVNLLCDRSLEIGCARQTRNIDARIVRAAARDLKLTTLPSMPRVWRADVAAAAAAAAIVVMIPFAWRGASAKQTAEAAVQAVPAPAAEASAASMRAVSARADGVMNTLQSADTLAITVATFETEQRARAVAAELVDAGLPAFTRRHASGAHQVIVGPYVSAEETLAAQRALAAQGVSGTEVTLERAVAVSATGEMAR
jgi:general secretion pathway protein A